MPPASVAAHGEIAVLPIGKIKPYPHNPRRIPEAAVEIVAKSLTEFGWQQPLVVDSENVLIVGHTRLLAAKSLGQTKVPVVVATGLTDEQIKAYRIADNRTSDYTGWDYTELTKQLDELSDSFADVLGLADWQGIVAQLDEDDDGELPDVPVNDDVVDRITAEKNALIVTFDSEDARDEAELTITGLDGVVDVRHKR